MIPLQRSISSTKECKLSVRCTSTTISSIDFSITAVYTSAKMYGTFSPSNNPITWRPNKLTLALMIIVPLGLVVYFWGSQYYYPSNYIATTGRVTNSQIITGPKQNTAFYDVQFKTNQGQQIIYRYEAAPYSLTKGQTLPLHYNQNNAHQVRIKPPQSQFIDEAIVIVALPLAILFIVKVGGKYLQNLFKP